jgi:diaminopimelate epimerase
MSDGLPEVDLQPATDLEPDRRDLLGPDAAGDERAVGFVRVGVPHVVIACDDAARVDLASRAPRVRHHPALRDGANVNFVSRQGSGWAIRTFERGVEEETLACGTGSVASALLLAEWGDTDEQGAGSPTRSTVVRLTTPSGMIHRVTLRAGIGGDDTWHASLAGTARIVYHGELGEGDWS